MPVIKKQLIFLNFIAAMYRKNTLAILCFLWHQSLSQLTTSGNMYQLVSGNDTDDNTSPFEKFTAYFECGQDYGCGCVAKEKAGGTFVKKTIDDALDETRYSAIWKERASGKYTITHLLCCDLTAFCRCMLKLCHLP